MNKLGPEWTPVATPFTCADGLILVQYDWAVPDGQPLRGVVLITHGLGEHAFRYQPLAQHLLSWGFAVRAYDHFGHGVSMGERGALPFDDKMLQDLVEMLQELAHRWPHQPRFLLGHSMGGTLAADCVARGGGAPLSGLVLSSPALDAGLSAAQKLLLATVARWLPNLRVGNGLKAEFLARDPAVVQAYLTDPLVHSKICGRLAQYITQAGLRAMAAAPQWPLPTLLMYAGADRLVSPAGSARFAQHANAQVQAQVFEPMYHEILNDPDKNLVYERLRDWLLERCGR